MTSTQRRRSDRFRCLSFAADPTADELTRATIRAKTTMYDGLWDAMYVLLLLGFAIGNLSFGLALTRVVDYFPIAALALTLTNLSPELKGPARPEQLASWAYPAIQPLGRLLIELWLWCAAKESEPLPCGRTRS